MTSISKLTFNNAYHAFSFPLLQSANEQSGIYNQSPFTAWVAYGQIGSGLNLSQNLKN